MRARVVALLVLALTLGAITAASAAAEDRAEPGRALLAFLPTEPAPERPLLDEFARRGFAVSLTSPTVGGYKPRQMMLDIGAGSRISTRAYTEKGRHLALRTEFPGGRIAGWDEAVARAEDSSNVLVPGLLASTLERAGRRVSYIGVLGVENEEAIAAADRRGVLKRVELTTLGTFTERALGLWRRSDLLVARLPGDRDGLDALDALMRTRRPNDLVLVVRAPPTGRLRLLETGLAEPGAPPGGRLRSGTTRRAGLVAATDYAPTLLDAFGVAVPDEMEGRQIERVPDGTPDDVRSASDRFEVVVTRRGPALAGWLGAVLVLLGALVLVRGRRGLPVGARIASLSALWLPALGLLPAVLAPSRTAEVLLLALGSLVLGAVTDRLLRWPAAPVLPAVVVLVAYFADLFAGSALSALSLAGPNPKGGARFFGIGNELETILSLTLLIGCGAALARQPGRVAARWFAAASVIGALVIGAGRLGADVGGVITLGVGGTAAVLAALAEDGRLPGRRALLLLAAVPLLGLGVLIGLDLVSGGDAHLTRSVLEADRPGDVLEIVTRRFEESFGGVLKLEAFPAFYPAALLLGVAVWRRRELLAPMDEAPMYRAGIIGAFAATVAGALSNDSGTVIVMIGTVLLLGAVAYGRARPTAVAPGGAPDGTGTGGSSTIPACA
jgi:hypothetical protein